MSSIVSRITRSAAPQGDDDPGILALHQGSLVAAGHFQTAGGGTVNNIAAWNGSSWATVGGGLGNGGFSNEYGFALSPWNGQLIGGGIFIAPGHYIAGWY